MVARLKNCHFNVLKLLWKRDLKKFTTVSKITKNSWSKSPNTSYEVNQLTFNNSLVPHPPLHFINKIKEVK